MKRLPFVATVVVSFALAAMLALGVWQLQRRSEKQALLARYTANLNLAPMTYPELAPVPPAAMFRKAHVHCLSVSNWRVEGGQTAGGQPGYRHIANCVTGAERPGALVDMGVSANPTQRLGWSGGIVDGLITTEPSHESLIGRIFAHAAPLRPMLVADVPAPGLAASTPPDPASIPNNHLAYAVQWFAFAGVALVIYVVALRRRG